MLLKLFILAALAVTINCLPATNVKEPKICQTDACKRAALTLLNQIDQSKNPCDDWFLYACGKFAEANPLPEGVSSIQTLGLVDDNNNKRGDTVFEDDNLKNHGSKVVQKAKKLYDECVGSSDSTLIITLTKRNRDYLLALREKAIKMLARPDVSTYRPINIPTIEQILTLKMDKKGECRTTVASQYEYAYIRAFLDKYMDRNATAEARKMINNIHSTILNRLNITWATEEDKNTYRDQLSKLERNLLYPDWIVDDKELDSEYGIDTVESIYDILKNKVAKHNDWPMPVLMVNAHFSSANEISKFKKNHLKSKYNYFFQFKSI